MPGLRHWKIGGYLWLVFYIVGDHRIEILRCSMHAAISRVR